MPIHQTVWRIGDMVRELDTSGLSSESELESIIQDHAELLNPNWLVIGRQVLTSYNHYVDLLALDRSGSLIVIELKRDRTPRDVVAQALDYASWVKDLSPADVAGMYKRFCRDYLSEQSGSLDDAFRERFGLTLEEDCLNSSHQVVIVASELDSSTERIISYLADSGVAINVVFFRVFVDGGNRYLSRAWFLDPRVTEDAATLRMSKEPWNGEFYVSFGDPGADTRSWDDARQYGFISGGGGTWHSQTLSLLSVGDRVWVNIPQTGYVGVGRVTDRSRKADEVRFHVNGDRKSIFELSDIGYHREHIGDDDKAEYIVRIEWLKTVDRAEAVKEVGFFGNQNTVCRPTTSKWNHTVERLKKMWGITD